MKLVTKIFKRDDWYITSHYGYRPPIHTKNGVTKNFHYGCDYGTHKKKWPQYAIEDGTIIDCGRADDGAKYVWVNYPKLNIRLLHYHLSKICVKKGQSIKDGTLIGYTGSTGKATGIHLHLGMKYNDNDEFINPHEFNY